VPLCVAVTVAAAGGTSAYQYKLGSGAYQSTFDCEEMLALKAALGCVIITVVEAVQLFASSTVSVYVPAAKEPKIPED